MTNLKAISEREVNFSVKNANVEIRLHKGEYTRQTACQIATTTLFARNTNPSIQKIDDLCFVSWGFPISHRKNKPMKNTGGMTVKRRIENYLYNNDTFIFNVATEKFECSVKFATLIASMQKVKARKEFLFSLHEKRVVNPLKNISLNKFKKSVSSALYMHLVQSGKLSY